MPQQQAIPQSVYGYAVRNPYKSEDVWFAMNTDTTGMAAEDGRIVLTPYSGLTDAQKTNVAKNEAIRLFMFENNINPQFKVTPKQAGSFQGTAYGEKGKEGFMRQTLVARILTNDKSAEDVTDEQRKVSQDIMQQLAAKTRGAVQSGNIDLNRRPVVKNKDGSISTVESMSIGTPLGETLIPTIDDSGRRMAPDEAIAAFRKSGKHLGVYPSIDAATSAAKEISNRQAEYYKRK